MKSFKNNAGKPKENIVPNGVDVKKGDEAIAELEEKIESMKKDKESKCKAAKEQLLEALSVTAEKYGTATGVAEALRTIRFVFGTETPNDLAMALDIAEKMENETLAMMAKASELDYLKMDSLCDEFFLKDYVESCNHDDSMQYSYEDLAFELMRIDLCRNVGGAASDMTDFIKRVQEEIDATGEQLKLLRKGE